ncbi:MAG: 5-methylthioadenosine phosphorylase [Acidimicrobiaceae bacterium]|jgi:5'-methylthioadenosine phosphorylase
MTDADIGVFGGSGFYAFLDDVEEHKVTTPFGDPSAPVTIGRLGETRVAFIPRHGPKHEFPPHRVNYRANVHAMRELGVRALLAPFAAGSLQPTIHPGDFVVVDQFVDRTSCRPDTFYDSFDDGPVHVSLADPYDEPLRQQLVTAARALGITVHDGGTVVVVQGPRFSTRAESSWYRSQGWDVINMTQYPEAALAREAGIAYAAVALVTDYDTGLEGEPGEEPVTQEQVFAFFEDNAHRVRELLFTMIPRLA